MEALPDGAAPVEADAPSYYRWHDANGEITSDFFNHFDEHLRDFDAWLTGLRR